MVGHSNFQRQLTLLRGNRRAMCSEILSDRITGFGKNIVGSATLHM